MRGPSTMRCRVVIAAMVLVWNVGAAAQGPTYGLGRTPTNEELHPADAAVGPDGEGLPRGRGTAKEGATVWLATSHVSLADACDHVIRMPVDKPGEFLRDTS